MDTNIFLENTKKQLSLAKHEVWEKKATKLRKLYVKQYKQKYLDDKQARI